MPAPAKTTTASRSAAKTAERPVARFRFRVTAGGVIAIGPGKISLLEAISETGSITAAAKSLEMSYRRAWLLLDELNRSLRQPAVDSAKGGQHGGGSELTPTGLKLIQTYRQIEHKAHAACASDIKLLVSLLAN